MSEAPPEPRLPRQLLIAVVAAPIIVGLAILVFTWPNARAQPRHVPLGVVASGTAGDALAGRLGAAHGMFAVHRYADTAALDRAIRQRDVDAGVDASGTPPRVLVAGAAGPQLGQQIEPVLTTVVTAVSGKPAVRDLVPSPAADPTGSVIGGAVLPLTLAGEISAVLLAFSVRPGARQVGALAVVSAAIGLIGVAIVQEWLGALDGGTWWIEAGVLALTVFAIGAIVVGLHALLGRFGLPVAVALLVFVGNAFSGAMSAPELLPPVVHRVGQWLPPGAGNELLRSAAFFHGHGWVHPFVVLAVWIVLGLAAASVGGVLAERRLGESGRHERHDTTAATAPISG